MDAAISRAGRWWWRDPQGNWFTWNPESSSWTAAAPPPPPPPPAGDSSPTLDSAFGAPSGATGRAASHLPPGARSIPRSRKTPFERGQRFVWKHPVPVAVCLLVVLFTAFVGAGLRGSPTFGVVTTNAPSRGPVASGGEPDIYQNPRTFEAASFLTT